MYGTNVSHTQLSTSLIHTLHKLFTGFNTCVKRILSGCSCKYLYKLRQKTISVQEYSQLCLRHPVRTVLSLSQTSVDSLKKFITYFMNSLERRLN